MEVRIGVEFYQLADENEVGRWGNSAGVAKLPELKFRSYNYHFIR